MITIADLEAARSRIRDAVVTTPCVRSEHVSRLAGAQVWLKYENQQRTGSFKERGALNRLLALTAEERARGVICASAGNHALGVAYHAQRLGVRARIVMPLATPLVKLTSTRGYGADVILHGASFDEAMDEAHRLGAADGLTFIHGFDDPAVIAGQGTVGLELLEQNPYLDVVIVPVGGGGLIAGVALALKETNPKIRVIGVEAARVPSMKAALAQGSPVLVEPRATIAEGLAVRRVGALTLPLVQKYVDDIVLVDEEEIANAILLLLEREKSVAEGSGAAGVAALVQGKCDVAGKKVAVVVCGGNIDVNFLSRIIERGLVKDGRRVRLRVRVPDQPGALHGLTGVCARLRANVIEIEHSRTHYGVHLGDTAIDLVLETRGAEHIDELRAAMVAAGYEHERVA